MAKKNQYGYVYIFTNPSFREDWIKIGKTTDVEVRLKTLDTTALPLPFEKYATLKTIKYEKAEKHVHHYIERFTKLRIRDNREFFNVKPEDALKIFIDVAELLDDAEIKVFDENAQKILNKMMPTNPSCIEKEKSADDDHKTIKSDCLPRYSSLKTLANYYTYLQHSMTRDVMDKMGITADISEVRDITLLSKLREEVKQVEKERNVHHTHSSALSQYIKYIEAGYTWDDLEHDAKLVRSIKFEKQTKDHKQTTPPKAVPSVGNIRTPFRFSMAGLIKGDVITFIPTGVKVSILDDKNISYNGKAYTLSGFCRNFMPENRRIASNAYQGPKFFSYQGKNLWKIRLEKES